MAAAVPFAIKAGASLGGSLLGKFLSKPNKPQQAAVTGTQQLATQMPQYGAQLRQQGSAYTGEGAGNLSQAANYYRQILGPGRGATEAAIAPERGVALDYYRGAANRVGREARGPQRESQLAELERQKVGQLADLTGKARSGAVGGLAGVGGQQTGVGTALTGQGTYADTNALYAQQAAFNQQGQLRQDQQDTGNQWGKFIYDIMKSTPWGKPKAAATPLYT